MKGFLRKHGVVVVAFLLPIALVAGIALTVYVPSLFLTTDYNFVYAVCTNTDIYYPYNCRQYLAERYDVVGGTIVTRTIDLSVDRDGDGQPDYDRNYDARLFLHDTKKNESTEVRLDDLKEVNIDDRIISPDGVVVSDSYNHYRNDFFLFGGSSSSYGYYLTKGDARRKLHLIDPVSNYYSNDTFLFLGWVTPGRE